MKCYPLIQRKINKYVLEVDKGLQHIKLPLPYGDRGCSLEMLSYLGCKQTFGKL